MPNAGSSVGLGLGLAIVRHIVELHGGTVMAESPGRGCGSTFRIVLPAAAIMMADRSVRLPPSRNASADRQSPGDGG